eukprot:TRINITY_DN22666_c5_g1_i1.p1 TRINITY_DN22666_c5_g1~~TRINITY_DN22666_c5_g1_i1.p1  ORF type:complete len:200 (+),score=16.42 TRINITY_DN22666_c5_g1_i1:60-602(+)
MAFFSKSNWCLYALLALAASSGATGLEWQDCSLLADVKGLTLLEYSHKPDPIVLGQPYSITRRFKNLLGRQIHELNETVEGYNQTISGSEAWAPASFKNGPFSRCGTKDFQTACPIAADEEFRFEEAHPTTHVVKPGKHRAIEHYYADGVYAGCVAVVYSYAAAPENIRSKSRRDSVFSV